MKKITLKLAVLAAFIFGTGQVSAQEGLLRCGTVENAESVNSLNSNAPTSDQFENWIANKIAERSALSLTGGIENVKFTIPVVFHVIHDVSDGPGVQSNIPDARIMSQMRVLNEDYSNTGILGGANSSGLSVDTGIQFALATKDPSGAPTNGIKRYGVQDNAFPFATAANRANIYNQINGNKQHFAWDTTKYLNIYVVHMNNGIANDDVPAGTPYLAGFAALPTMSGLSGLEVDTTTAVQDGVVLEYRSVGSDDDNASWDFAYAHVNKGRTATHEIGHYLGLRHIGGDGNCDADDFVEDTPFQNGQTQGGGTCASLVGKNTCAKPGNDLYQNYMDYTGDACMDNFTQGQVDRMVAVMLNSPRRKELKDAKTADVIANPVVTIKDNVKVIAEPNNCDVTEVTVEVEISGAATGVTNLSLTSVGALVEGTDFEVENGAISFASGSTATQTFKVKVYDNTSVGNDTIKLNLAVTNSGATNATVTTTESKSLYISITDNDSSAPTEITQTVLNDDFEYATTDDMRMVWDRQNFAGGRVMISWDTASRDGLDVFKGRSVISITNGEGWFGAPFNVYEQQADYLVKKDPITIPANATKATLKARIGTLSLGATKNASELFVIYFIPTPAPAGEPEYEIVSATGKTLRGYDDAQNKLIQYQFAAGDTGVAPTFEMDMTPFKGKSGRISIYHQSGSSAQGVLVIDNVSFETTTPLDIQSATTASVTNRIKATGTVVIKNTTGAILGSIENTGGKDYGCVTTAITRVGNGGQAASLAPGDDLKVMDKKFKVTPTNVVTGNATMNFFVTKAELEGWESLTGKTRADLQVARIVGGTKEIVATTITAVPNNADAFQISAPITGGINGDYEFGTVEALSTSEFAFDVFTVYPNPTSDSVTINLSTQADVNVSLYDIRGREVLSNSFDNASSQFSKTIDVSELNTGIYVLEVESNGNKAIKKLVIK